MPHVFLATLGQRPEAITVALDLLRDRYDLDSAVILHTEPNVSGITKALNDLRRVLKRDYPALPVRYHELRTRTGAGLLDITDADSAMSYFEGIYAVLLDRRRQGVTLHLLVAGGRKAMSIYAALAAALVFSPYDHLWTVLSPSALVDKVGQFHIPPGQRDDVHLVQMPLLNARLPVGMMSAAKLDHPEAIIERLSNRRMDFLTRLTEGQRRVAEAFEQNPDATARELGRILDLGEKTIETHFGAIYHVMAGYLAFGEEIRHKRQALLDLLAGRL